MYIVQWDDSVPPNPTDGRAIVVMTTDGNPEGEPLFWTGDKIVGELIRKLQELGVDEGL